MEMEQEPIDWEQLGRQLGTLRDGGESVSGEDALRALELLLGEGRIRATVDHYVRGGRGSELARAVLWRLRPRSAVDRCLELYRTSAEPEDRRSAVELLRVVARASELAWIPTFLDDPDPTIQAWGCGVLDYLVVGGLVAPEACEGVLVACEHHSNPAVRECAGWIRKETARTREAREG